MNKLQHKTIIVAFSGGLTSATMAAILKQHYAAHNELHFVFYNTGLESEETLKFVDICDSYFNLNLTWLESYISPIQGKAVTVKKVNYITAARNGEPFESGIKKYGLPNSVNPWCSRRLKSDLVRKWAVQNKIRKYYTAIGIRADELDRINPDYKTKRLFYPLAFEFPMDKRKVYEFWQKQPFTLGLKSFEGNCTLCFKKSRRKLLTLISEAPERCEWYHEMEMKYKGLNNHVSMYRNRESIVNLWRAANQPFKKAICDNYQFSHNPTIFENEEDTPNGCEESCTGFGP